MSVLHFFKKRFSHLVGTFRMLRFKLNQKVEFLRLHLHGKTCALREKSPNTEFFLARIFPHSD